MLSVGDSLPDFDLPAADGDAIVNLRRESLKGKWTILFCYPEDFSFICPTEVTGFNSHLADARKVGAQIIGFSTDPVNIHMDWIKELGIKYPLISDEEGKFSIALGILDQKDSRCNRATFIVGPDLRIEFVMVTSRNIGRSVKETMRIMDAIHSGERCPADWHSTE